MTISTNRESDRFMLRLPDGMRDRLKEEAAKNNRSMNAEIIARLEASFSAVTHGNVFGVAVPLSDEEKKQARLLASAFDEWAKNLANEGGLFGLLKAEDRAVVQSKHKEDNTPDAKD